MAFIISTSAESGIIITDSYARVDSIFGSKTSLAFTLNYYIDQSAFISGNAFVKQERYEFAPSVEEGSSNFIKQAYEYLKTLSNFVNAEDA
ncbi:hypothetical protein EXW96_26520 [Paenibacillus sp. JMULE4]|uniref:hypothetical protein n=1 Tax=Paenibacillus sp. JMULE4 TaxID=2518342 RepID=UPI001576B9EC|nr:hypothetical protein [Paenibacillus sp. JMULE4]NTZ20945.1 hypothetical protein [Paenibacillus sp. JMULE4]